MSKLNNSGPRPARRPASFLQPSPGARASPRVPPRRALTLVTAGTVETWSGAARRRPNLISRGSTLARGAAHHRVIMLSERINKNIYLQSVLQWPVTVSVAQLYISWFNIHLHSHLRLSAKTGTLIEETKTEGKKWQIFHTRVITGTQKQEKLRLFLSTGFMKLEYVWDMEVISFSYVTEDISIYSFQISHLFRRWAVTWSFEPRVWQQQCRH